MGLFDKSEKKPPRFAEKCSQGLGMTFISVIVDTETGVNYLLTGSGANTNVTPLLGPDGKIVVDEISENFGEKVY